MANFFINRPVFAWVLAIVVMLCGMAAILKLPISQYPTIAPPAVSIQANYVGASADTVEATVVQVIEQQMRGLDNLLYISSTSDDFGTAEIRLTFAPGTSPDIAQVQVQNKLQLAVPQLPTTVQQSGISVNKSSTNQILAIAFVSADGSMSRDALANFIASNVQDPLSRITGVGGVQLHGSQFAMRIWLDAAKLNSYRINPQEVVTAIQEQNVQIAGGALGGTPPIPGQLLQATITQSTLFRTPQQFSDILLKVNPDGSQVRIGDVARVELAGQDYNYNTQYSGMPAAALGVQLAPGANALEVVHLSRALIDEMKPFLPPGMEVKFPSDVSPFVKASIYDVAMTLVEGIVLVFLVMYLFLQNFRATLIPTIAVPVVLLGTFAVIWAVGGSINVLSMFGLVLAIGLLVDDAIVVVENVERHMTQDGMSPKEATRKAMSEITGALIGVALVLSAVFVPVAFSGGAVGAIYRQFSLTIVVAMVLSVLTALILTPTLCATLLKSNPHGHTPNRFFRWFNRSFDKGQEKYQHGVRKMLRRPVRFVAIYLLLILATAFIYKQIPSAFLPEEDRSNFFVLVQTPTGTTQEKTAITVLEVGEYLRELDGVASTWEINGFSFSGRGQNSGLVFADLKLHEDRPNPEQSVAALVAQVNQHFAPYKDAVITAGAPPAIPELGSAAGFDLQLQDRTGVGHAALMRARDQLLAEANKNPVLAQVRAGGLEDTAKFKVTVDREKASAMGISAATNDQAFAIAWGSSYVNNFLDSDNRVKRVFVQGDAKWRMSPENLNDWFLRNTDGDMVPFSAFGASSWTYGSPRLERYNGMPSIRIQGVAAPGFSTGEAMEAMEAIVRTLPDGIGSEWTGMSFQEKQSGSQAPILYVISVLFVFLCLAALYESWAIPASVIMVVPVGVCGALIAAFSRGLENDVFFQVALLTTVGLCAKNSILIVEFARHLVEQGKRPFDAAVEAAALRLRPILMTSIAFVLGIMPLAFSNGAGAASQNSIGTSLIGGMMSSTFLAIFFTPLFFYGICVMIDWVRRKKSSTKAEGDLIA